MKFPENNTLESLVDGRGEVKFTETLTRLNEFG